MPAAFPVGGTLAHMWIAVNAADLSQLPGVAKPALEYGAGTRGAITSYSVSRVPPINSVIATNGKGLFWKNDFEASGVTYGLWPTLVNFPDAETTTELDALARGVWRVYPVDSIAAQLGGLQDPAARGAALMLWDDFDLGDAVPVYIRGARRTITGTATVREATVEVDAEGAERTASIVLDLAAVA
jgi:hypothetical protein